MKLGLFMMPLHTQKLGYKEMYDQDMAAALHADALGYDEFWLGEHTSARVEPISNSLQFMSALIPQTKHLTFGTGVINLPNHHPAQVAADVALFDHMSNGRFIMGVGPGGLATDFELFGSAGKNRAEMMIEAHEMIRKIWASDPPYDIAGKYWTIRIVESAQLDLGIGPMPKPYQDPFPLPYTSAMNPHSGMASIAGERGWGLISANFNAPWVLASHWETYVKGAEKAGLKPDRDRWRVVRTLLVTDSDAEAADYWARPDNAILDYYNYMFTQFIRTNNARVFMATPDADPQKVTLKAATDAMVTVGSPRTVTDRLVALIDEVGPFGGLLVAFHEWDDEPIWRRSMQLLAEKVMPAVAAHAAATRSLR
jgi:alkanesulfonate monooxygenase SsuD/methylene tetrahydromethanopterin reductase-like flavin-dependent oxidoreductase (luciferase family)